MLSSQRSLETLQKTLARYEEERRRALQHERISRESGSIKNPASPIKDSGQQPLTAENIMSPLESVSASTSVSQVMRKMLGVSIDNGQA